MEKNIFDLYDFDINIVMSSVLESGVFFKDSGLWQYYWNDNDFNDEIIAITQSANEDFEDFLKRVVLHEFKRDEQSDEPLTQINYAIYTNLKKL